MKKILLIAFVVLGAIGCSKVIKKKTTIIQNIKREQLLSSEFVGTVAKKDVNKYFPERKELKGNIDNLPKYDIDLYKIKYNSIYRNKPIQHNVRMAVENYNKDGGHAELIAYSGCTH